MFFPILWEGNPFPDMYICLQLAIEGGVYGETKMGMGRQKVQQGLKARALERLYEGVS